jgi:hypothetical protein
VVVVAVSSNGVAVWGIVVGGIVALVGSTVGPLVTWKVANRGWAQQRQLAVDERLYASRSGAYSEVLEDVARLLMAMEGLLDRAAGSTTVEQEQVQTLSWDESHALDGRIAAFASVAAEEAYADFSGAADAFAEQLQEAAARSIEDVEPISAATVARLRRRLEEAWLAQKRVTWVMKTDLAGVPTPPTPVVKPARPEGEGSQST